MNTTDMLAFIKEENEVARSKMKYYEKKLWVFITVDEISHFWNFAKCEILNPKFREIREIIENTLLTATSLDLHQILVL